MTGKLEAKTVLAYNLANTGEEKCPAVSDPPETITISAKTKSSSSRVNLFIVTINCKQKSGRLQVVNLAAYIYLLYYFYFFPNLNVKCNNREMVD